MRHKLFMSWAALRWVLLMFLIAPGMEAPLVAHLNQPVKPIKTWVGNSSWYGPGFNGRKTANGERFDSEALTAAHPNLPFGSNFPLLLQTLDLSLSQPKRPGPMP